MVSTLRCLGQSADKGHCVSVVLSRKTLDLCVGVYMGAAATKNNMTCYGKEFIIKFLWERPNS